MSLVSNTPTDRSGCEAALTVSTMEYETKPEGFWQGYTQISLTSLQQLANIPSLKYFVKRNEVQQSKDFGTLGTV